MGPIPTTTSGKSTMEICVDRNGTEVQKSKEPLVAKAIQGPITASVFFFLNDVRNDGDPTLYFIYDSTSPCRQKALLALYFLSPHHRSFIILACTL